MTNPTRDPSLLGSIGEVAKAGAGYLADLLARIVHGIQGAVIAPIAAFALGTATVATLAGCEAPESKAAQPPKADIKPVPVDASLKEEGPKKLGSFTITFYYVAGEEEVVAKAKAKAAKAAALAKAAEARADGSADAEDSDNDDNDDSTDAAVGSAATEAELAATAPPEMVTLYAKNGCEPIAEVTRDFAHELRVQGTGKLRDGRVLNIWGHCNCETSPCYKVIQHQWGTAGNGRPLQPFRTVAVDPKLIKLGSLLYVPLLEGRVVPGRAPWGGFVHDGCVVADDTGGGIKGEQLDLFVGKRGWFLGMSGSRGSHSWARHVPVFDGSKICERKGRRVAKKAGGV